MALTNRQVRLAARPVGLPGDDVWDFTEEPVGEPGDGEVLVRLEYLSVDPAMRGWMNDAPSYLPPVGIGDVMRAGGVGRVVASKHDGYGEGDHVYGTLGVQEHAVVAGDAVVKVDPDLAPLPVFLGALGMTGLTAYFGLLDVGALKEGETVVVSAAAGAVGSVVGQIAKIKGCRAVGIAGGEEKCRHVVEDLGFDAAIDYRQGDVAKRLREHAPDRVDVYFDNVGGEILDAVLPQLARHARVVICGAISQYNETGGMRGPSNYMSLLVNRSRMEGFLVFDYAGRFPEATREMAGWRAEGRLRSREDVVEGGIEAFPGALRRLFEGRNVGKVVVRMDGDAGAS